MVQKVDEIGLALVEFYQMFIFMHYRYYFLINIFSAICSPEGLLT